MKAFQIVGLIYIALVNLERCNMLVFNSIEDQCGTQGEAKSFQTLVNDGQAGKPQCIL